MKKKLVFLFFASILAFIVTINGCNKEDNPVVPGGVTQLNANGTIVAWGHTQAQGTMFVSDQDGKPISGLSSSNVSASLSWGTADHVDTVTTGVVSVTSNSQNGSNVAGAITMDLSGSMNPPYGQSTICMKNGVKNYINSMRQGDLTEIIKFSDAVAVIQTFTADKNLLITADTSAWSGDGGSTALYQSIYQATNDVKGQSTNLVRAVVAFTDGGENNSTVSRSDMISNALTNGIPVYTIFLYADTTNSYYRDMKNIADTTGGFNFWSQPSNCSNLSQIYNTISGQLTGSYSLAITWQGTLPPTGTVVKATITVTYNSLSSSFTRSYVMVQK